MSSVAAGVSRRPVVLAVAPNGGRRLPSEHPAVPVTPAALARTAAACLEAGAAMLHLHVRDAAGRHLLEAGAYRAALAEVRAAVGERLFLQITSESLGAYAPAAQFAVVRDVRPEGVSLALREVLPADGDERELAAFLLWLQRERVVPQFILYEAAEAVRLVELVRRGVVPWARPPVLFGLGRYVAGQRAGPEMLAAFLPPAAPAFADWMACAFGPAECACVLAAARAGGHARVGFENNLHLPDGTVAPDNAALVAATAQALRGGGFELATGGELRARWTSLCT